MIGIFGQFVQDNITVGTGTNSVVKATWKEESAGKLVLLICFTFIDMLLQVPNYGALELLTRLLESSATASLSIPTRHSTPKNTAYSELHPSHSNPSLAKFNSNPSWGYYDFPTDFPNGVNFTIGKSDIAKDWNYIHWSVFGPNFVRKTAAWDNMNNWTINFDYARKVINPKLASTATFTVQLAGAKTARWVFLSTFGWIEFLFTSIVAVVIPMVSLAELRKPSSGY